MKHKAHITKHKKRKLFTENRGVSLLLTLLIMAALLAIAFGISRLSLGEIKITRDVPKSLVAYYAAEAGVEQVLYNDRTSSPPLPSGSNSECLDPPTNEICYVVEFSGDSPNRTIRSNGSYKEVRRTIEVTY